MASPPAPQTIGRYRIYAKIGSGGMATVHLGRLEGAAGFARIVAIKRLHPHLVEESEFRATMVDEARLAARIRHPNVVPTLDVVSRENDLLVVMEYVRGESLGRLVGSGSGAGGRIPLPIVSAIAVGALHGLQAAHEAKSDQGTPLHIVHRDVSPQNILVGTDGVPRVIDFGVAKAAGRVSTTREGVIKGKLSYMAPEQLGTGEVDRRADVYAMSVVLWEMLTGARMLQGADPELIGKIMAGVAEAPSRRVPGLPRDLDALVVKGLAKDPDDRFESAREMADALVRAVTPAFAADVGAWVEQTARESLAEHEALLAEIEGRSGMAAARAPEGAPGDLSRASSLSVETARTASRGGKTQGARSAAALAIVAVLAGSLGAWIARSGERRPLGSGAAAASVAPEIPSPVATTVSPPAEAPAPSPVPTQSATSAVPSSSSSPSRARGPSRHHESAASTPARSPAPAACAAPRASDPIVFTRPD